MLSLIALIGQRDQAGDLQLGQDPRDPLGLLVVPQGGSLFGSWSTCGSSGGDTGHEGKDP